MFSSLRRLAPFTDCASYLAHCRSRRIDLDSSIFNGTMYEYTTKAFLESTLECFGFQMTGGAYDNGIDLLGKWNLAPFWEHRQQQAKKVGRLNSKSILKSSIEYNEHTGASGTKFISLASDINVVVQCKNFNKRVAANTVREFAGVYMSLVTNKSELQRTFLFLVSPFPLTPQGHSYMEASKIPMIHFKLLPLQLKPGVQADDRFDINNWTGAAFKSAYMNGAARDKLKGLDLEVQLIPKTKLVSVL